MICIKFSWLLTKFKYYKRWVWRTDYNVKTDGENNFWNKRESEMFTEVILVASVCAFYVFLFSVYNGEGIDSCSNEPIKVKHHYSVQPIYDNRTTL